MIIKQYPFHVYSYIILLQSSFHLLQNSFHSIKCNLNVEKKPMAVCKNTQKYLTICNPQVSNGPLLSLSQ